MAVGGSPRNKQYVAGLLDRHPAEISHYHEFRLDGIYYRELRV